MGLGNLTDPSVVIDRSAVVSRTVHSKQSPTWMAYTSEHESGWGRFGQLFSSSLSVNIFSCVCRLLLPLMRKWGAEIFENNEKPPV